MPSAAPCATRWSSRRTWTSTRSWCARHGRRIDKRLRRGPGKRRRGTRQPRDGEAARDTAASHTNHGAEAWTAEDGLKRAAYTILAGVLTGVARVHVLGLLHPTWWTDGG